MPCWSPFFLSDKARLKLEELVRQCPSVFSFAENRPLAATLSSIGLIAEMGGPLDRLSVHFEGGSPWKGELVVWGNEVGARLWREEAEELKPLTEGLAQFLHPFSVDPKGRLSHLIIFPALVADQFRKVGLELVIVRDWILNSGLKSDRSKAVEYTKSNLWEITENLSHTHASLIHRRKLPFFGTHDLADHLMGADCKGLDLSQALTEKVLEKFEMIFEGGMAPSFYSLIISYLIGLALDDLAQPRWYGSVTHRLLVEELLLRIEAPFWEENDIEGVFLPTTFNQLVAAMRSPLEEYKEKIRSGLGLLEEELLRYKA